MGTKVLKNAYIEIGGNNLSAYANQVSLPLEVDTLDATAFGDDTKKSVAGLKSWSSEIQFHQDWTDNALDEILWGLFDAGAAVTIKIRPENSAKAPANPEYTGSAIIKAYSPVGNGVGELAGASISLVAAGTLQRLTA